MCVIWLVGLIRLCLYLFLLLPATPLHCHSIVLFCGSLLTNDLDSGWCCRYPFWIHPHTSTIVLSVPCLLVQPRGGQRPGSSEVTESEDRKEWVNEMTDAPSICVSCLCCLPRVCGEALCRTFHKRHCCIAVHLVILFLFFCVFSLSFLVHIFNLVHRPLLSVCRRHSHPKSKYLNLF